MEKGALYLYMILQAAEYINLYNLFRDFSHTFLRVNMNIILFEYDKFYGFFKLIIASPNREFQIKSYMSIINHV